MVALHMDQMNIEEAYKQHGYEICEITSENALKFQKVIPNTIRIRGLRNALCNANLKKVLDAVEDCCATFKANWHANRAYNSAVSRKASEATISELFGASLLAQQLHTQYFLYLRDAVPNITFLTIIDLEKTIENF